jgi:hypothetical protein
MARETKSEAERAQASLAVAERKVAKLRKRSRELRRELETVDKELREADAIRAYRAQHPALPQNEQPAVAAEPGEGADESGADA